MIYHAVTFPALVSCASRNRWRATRAVLALASSAYIDTQAQTAPAIRIASLTGDFRSVSFPAGWQYLRNTGPIGNSANYTPLLWDATNARYDITGSIFPAPGSVWTNITSSGNLHPGWGTVQGVAFKGCVITAYTIQAGQAGLVSLVNGSLRGENPNGAGGGSDGWDLLIFVGNTQVGAALIIPWSSTATPFTRALGMLNIGDVVYVAVGPNGNHNSDGAILSFQLDSTQSVPGASTVPQITSAFTASGILGQTFSYTITATGSPTGFEALNLPPVLSVNGITGLISGVPAQAGVFPVNIAASNAAGRGSAGITLTIPKTIASIMLGSLIQTFDGSPKRATATTSPIVLPVAFTYNGSATPPTNAGSYAVVATIDDANYTGRASGTLVIGAPGQGPAITAQPQNVSAVPTYATSFRVTATGSALTYQWYKNGVAIAGSPATALLSLPIVDVSHAGAYTVVVRNSSGSVTSSQAILTVVPPLTISTFAGRAPMGSDDGDRDVARFSIPLGVACDGAGNVYVADSGNHTIRKVTPEGVVTTIAGSPGLSGSSDGSANAARFFSPSGLALDNSGILYVADAGNHTIRKITPAGIVTTLAGAARQTGNTDGVSIGARFNLNRSGLAVGGDGNIYIADTNNSTIRKITPAGVVTTFAGQAGQRGSVDGVGGDARFTAPYSVAIDPTENIYVADSNNRTIRKITPAGLVTTLAGTATSNAGQQAADGTGPGARFSRPTGVAVDSAGNVYGSEYNSYTVRKVTALGVVTTLAGTAKVGAADGIGGAAQFDFPWGLAVDGDGNVYVADANNNTVRKITSGGVVSTLAGIPLGNVDGTGSAARFSSPSGIAADRDGNLYVSDTGNRAIRKITAAGVVTTLASAVTRFDFPAAPIPEGVRPARTEFAPPGDIALDKEGNLYVVFGVLIRKVSLDGVVTNFAGAATETGSADGLGGAARFNSITGIVVDDAGNVYVSDSNNYTIRKITPTGNVTTLAGAAGQRGSVDANGNAARFSEPLGLTVDRHGTVYVSDRGSIRKISPAGDVTTLPGNTGSEIDPHGLAVDSDGNVYIAERIQNRIRKLTVDGVMTTVAGGGGAGNANRGSADGTGAMARFFAPIGILQAPDGCFYVADTSNHTIRKAVPVVYAPFIITQPTSAVFGNSSSVTLSVVVGINSGVTYQWLKDGSPLPEATTASLVIPNTGAPQLSRYTVTVTNSAGSVTSTAALISAQENRNPNVQASATSTILRARTDLTFLAAATDPDGEDISYQWVFGDGMPGATTATATHRWLKGGIYTVKVTATDERGGSATHTFDVTLNDPMVEWNRSDVTLPNGFIYDVIYGGGQFVASAGGRTALVSRDGINWTLGPRSSQPIVRLAFGNGRYLAAGAFGLGQQMSHSSDGLVWEAGRGAPSALPIDSVVFGAGRFVGVGSLGKAIVSTNGIDWIESSTGLLTALSRVRYGDGLFIAVGQAGRIITSPDGLTWTLHTIPGATSTLTGIARHSGTWYVGVGVEIWTSRDGFDWTRGAQNSSKISSNFYSVGGVLVRLNLQVGGFELSENAVDWATVPVGGVPTLSCNAIAEHDGTIVIVGNSTMGSVTGFVYHSRIPPVISRQPVAQASSSGGSIVLSVELANGSGARYQWNINGTPIPGALDLNLTVPAGAIGSYTITATNSAGSTISSPSLVSAALPNPGRLINLSVRTRAGTGGQTLIMGVVLGGADTNGTKPVLIRGIGPSLGNFGVTGFLADPTITVGQGPTNVAANDNWGGTTELRNAFSQVGAFTLEGTSKDSAVLLLSPAGSYTVQLSGVGGTTGEALAEIYDATPAESYRANTPRLINVSARTQIGDGGSALVAGFVVAGSTGRTVLIRAIGPTLRTFGVTDALVDPKLELYSGPTLLDANDNWGGSASLVTAFTQVGSFALELGSRDSALLATLQPGNYTAQVSGVAGASGIVLVEIYEVP